MKPFLLFILTMFSILNAQRTNIIGEFDTQELKKEPHSKWFTKTKENYKSNPDALKKLASLLSDPQVYIEVFMGTWCPDSQRQVPPLIHILEKLDFKNHIIVGISEDKSEPKEQVQEKQIKFVPTIIFYKKGKEINRIVEFPIETLEKDMISILTNKDYKNSHSEE